MENLGHGVFSRKHGGNKLLVAVIGPNILTQLAMASMNSTIQLTLSMCFTIVSSESLKKVVFIL